MQDVRKGDTVVIHGRALIDGRTVADAIVTGVGDRDHVSAKIDRGNGTFFDLPGVAAFGETSDGSNFWTWPKDGDGKDVLPDRGPVDDQSPAA